MQSGICKWHVWCDGHSQTGLKYVSAGDIILKTSMTKWQLVLIWIGIFHLDNFYASYTWWFYANARGKTQGSCSLKWKFKLECGGFSRPGPWPNDSLQTRTHAQRGPEKGVRQRERECVCERGREVFIKWPVWILSKGFVSLYGDLENSPCSLIPLLLLWLKGIQCKLHSPKWAPVLTLLILLTTDGKGA